MLARLVVVQEPFAPPDTAWIPVSPRLATMRRTLLGTFGVLGLVAILVVVLSLGGPGWLAGLLAVVWVAVVGFGWWLVGRNARWWGYAERDDELYIRRGALNRSLVVVPYGRMQYVDVHAGPIEQAFKLANVHLHTASPGTSAHIPGLPAPEAARLRDRLTDLGESQAAGL